MTAGDSSSGLTTEASDIWFDWLLRVRHGADAGYACELQRMLDDIRDRLLDHAAIEPGSHVVDIGSGDGLVAFGALARDPTVRATLVDISPALIAHTRDIARERGMLEHCRFVVASAEALDPIPEACADVVTMRAVIAYLADKPAAIREMYRILRPGGRVSVVDPIFADRAFALAGLASRLPFIEPGPAARFAEFAHRCGSAHLPDTVPAIRANSLTGYDERDLLGMFENAGFTRIHLRLHIDSIPALPIPWQTYLATSPRAGAPTIQEILASAFTPAERIEFEQLFRPRIESGATTERNVNVYLYADKP